MNSGEELPNLVDDDVIRNSLVQIAVQSFPSRDPGTFTGTSKSLILEALQYSDFSFEAMDVLLSISLQPSFIDARWLDELLRQQSLAKRDAYWCGYLHDRFESQSTVSRLINAAFDLPLNQLEHEVAERWCTVLLWFTAAADRRVKDKATRAATAILTAKPKILRNVLLRLIVCDDDAVRERTLLSCYGALILSRDADVIQTVTAMLHNVYRSDPKAFDNALIRDHVRCISELAQKLDVLPEGCDPALTMHPVKSDWPLELPSNNLVEAWGKLPLFKPNEFLSDFFKYSMNCLDPWMHSFLKKDMGEWILQRITSDFGYEGSGCERYDHYMLSKYGGGRSKPVGAERIGKKYQWISMYHLASWLHDHIEYKQDSWKPVPLQTRLILLEERKLDPTISSQINGNDRNAEAWWIGDSANLQIGKQLSDSDWVKCEDDLPSLKKLLLPKECNGQRWLLLVSYPTWDNRPEDNDLYRQYRQVWMNIESYLVAKDDVDIGYNCLHRRNFFGSWMNKGASWSYGFAGEYPWATPFNLEPEEWHSDGGFGHELPVVYTPTWNKLVVEWEYDASLSEKFHMLIPNRVFFPPSELWWNGQDGYRIENGETLFRDTSICNIGPGALIADIDDLLIRLDKLGVQLIWTILGEKWILGGMRGELTPQRTFSQVARLEEDGSIKIGDRVFFDDYNKDVGPKSQ